MVRNWPHRCSARASRCIPFVGGVLTKDELSAARGSFRNAFFALFVPNQSAFPGDFRLPPLRGEPILKVLATVALLQVSGGAGPRGTALAQTTVSGPVSRRTAAHFTSRAGSPFRRIRSGGGRSCEPVGLPGLLGGRMEGQTFHGRAPVFNPLSNNGAFNRRFTPAIHHDKTSAYSLTKPTTRLGLE